MTARAFLIRGLIAGLLAGFAAFAVAYTVGEPHVQTAIELEESGAAPAEPLRRPGRRHHAVHSHDRRGDGTVVSATTSAPGVC